MRLLLLTAALFVPSLVAAAAEVAPTRATPLFSASPSMPEVRAARKHAKAEVERALASGRPLELSVARSGGTTMISLESVVLCNSADGCPLLVFRNIDKPPVLTTMSFHNLTLEYRDKGTYLIPRRSGPPVECLISIGGKAKCLAPKPAKKGKP